MLRDADVVLLFVWLDNSQVGVDRRFHALVTALISDMPANGLLDPNGGVDMPSLIHLIGLGVLATQSSTGYAGWGRYAVDEEESHFCGIDGILSFKVGSGGCSFKDGGTDSRW